MESPSVRAVCLFSLLLLSSCGPPSKYSESTSCGQLPAPPYPELKNSSPSDLDGSPVCVRTRNMKEMIDSIPRLLSPHPQRVHLEELCYQMFQKLASSQDIDTTIMTLLATSASHHPLSISICKNFMHSRSPLIQLIAVQSLARTNGVDSLLLEALRSDFVAVRLEAAWQIAQRRSENSFFHIDALYHKLPAPFRPHMAQLYAQERSSGSVYRLRQMLYDTDDDVVTSALLAIGRHNVSELNSEIVNLTAHAPRILEALSYALQTNESRSARQRLHKLCQHTDPHVQLQASLSLIKLGEFSSVNSIVAVAEEGNLYALSALGSCKTPLPSIPQISTSRTHKINYALSLLEHKDAACVPYLKEILSLAEDEILTLSFSPAHTHSYWEISTLYSFPSSHRPMLYERSLMAKEHLLAQTLELDDRSFLDIAHFIFQQGRIELYPMLLSLMKNKRSDGVIELLRNESTRVGAPYNRAGATLGLIQLGFLPESNLEIVLEFSREKKEQPWRYPLPHLGPEEQTDKKNQASTSAQIYIEALETLSRSGSDQSITLLTKELSHAPTHFLPFVIEALLHATL